MPAPDLAQAESLYDGEIAYVDNQVGRLISALEAMGLRDATVVVLTSDHGEEFKDHRSLGQWTPDPGLEPGTSIVNGVESPPMPSASVSGRRRRAVLTAAVVSLLAFAVYANTLGHGFVYDDAMQILANPWITEVRYLPEVMTHGVWGFWPERGSSSYYRPLMHITNMAVYHVAGLSPWAYHLVNVALHAATSVMVLLLATRLLGNATPPSPLRLPFIAALLFASHPIHSEPVAWAGGLPDLSCAFFYLLSAHLYIETTEKENDSAARLPASLLAYLLALLAKEPALTLPLLLLAHDCTLRRKGIGRALRRLAPHLALSCLYLVVRYSVLGVMATSISSASLLSWLPAVPLLFVRYIAKLALPIGLNAYYGGPPFAERYLYLPSSGFVLLGALTFSWVAGLVRSRGPILIALAAVTITIYSAASIVRNQVWRDDRSTRGTRRPTTTWERPLRL
jgi:hypothetical protein